LENPQVEAFAKLELSEQFSEACVKALARELKAGARGEWFSVVQEAIVIDSLKFEIHWKTGTTVETRQKLKSTIEDTLSAIATSGKRRERASAELGLELDTEKTTVMSAQVPVVVGYRTRPLEPVYAGAMEAEGKK